MELHFIPGIAPLWKKDELCKLSTICDMCDLTPYMENKNVLTHDNAKSGLHLWDGISDSET